MRNGFVNGWIILFLVAAVNLDTVTLLYSSDSKVLSTEIFALTYGGDAEAASVLSLIRTALVTVAYLIARRIGRETQFVA